MQESKGRARRMKKRVVYIPDYHYLCHPLFFNIAKNAKDMFQNIYFNTKDPLFAITNKDGIKQEELNMYFDEYHELNDPLTLSNLADFENKLEKYRSVISFIARFRAFRIRLEKQLEMLKPDAVVTATDMGGYINRMCNIWAERNKVPFIIIQTSFLEVDLINIKTKLKNQLCYLLFNKLLNIPVFRRQHFFGNERPENYLFLWGDAFKNYYKGLKIEKNISITGNPAFDPIIKGESIEKGDDDIGIDIPNDKPIVIICTQILDGLIAEKDIREIDNLYRTVIKENPDLYFVVKIHPRQDLKRYSKIFDGIPKSNFTIVKNIDLYSLFKVADVQVSVSSYSSFEAVVFGIPIVVVKKDLITFFDHFNDEIELRADTAEVLGKHLRMCITKEFIDEFKVKKDKYLKSRLDYIDGKSGERVVEKIEGIMRRGREVNE
jgi:hypothetical protein